MNCAMGSEVKMELLDAFSTRGGKDNSTIRSEISKLIEFEKQRACSYVDGAPEKIIDNDNYTGALKAFGAALKKMNEDGADASIEIECFALLRRFIKDVCTTYRRYLLEVCEQDAAPSIDTGPKSIFAPTTLPPHANTIKDQVPLIRLTAPPQRGWGVLDSSGLDKASMVESKEDRERRLRNEAFGARQIEIENGAFEVLLQMVSSKGINPGDPAERYELMNEKFITSLFSWLRYRPLLPNETNWPPSQALVHQRNLLKATLHQIYYRFVHHRRFMRRHMVDVFTKLGLSGVQEAAKVRREIERHNRESRVVRVRQQPQQPEQPQPQQPMSAGESERSGGDGGVFKRPMRPVAKKRVRVSSKDVIESSRQDAHREKQEAQHPQLQPISQPQPQQQQQQTEGGEEVKERRKTAKVPPKPSLAGMSEMLEVVGSIIQGFRLPLREEHVTELLPALLSLHGLMGMVDEMTPVLSLYHKALSFCMAKFIEKDLGLAVHVILILIHKVWPKWNSKQEVLLWNELEELLEYCVPPSAEFRDKVVWPLMQHVTTLGIASPNFVIAQRALLLLSNPRVLELFDDHKCHTTFVPVLFKAATEHFNDTTKQMCYQVLLKFAKLEPSIYEMKTMRILKAQYDARERAEIEAENTKKALQKEKKTDLDLLSFAFGRTLGEGSYSQVRHAKLIGSHAQQRYWGEYALKVMSIQHLKEQNYLENAVNEALFLYRTSHPFIVSVLSYFEEDGKLYIVMEYAPGGDVFHVLENMGSVDEQYARFIAAEMVSALEFLHTEVGMAHLDIKPENLLLSEDGHIRLTDFGCSVNFREPKPTEGKPPLLQGTAEYLSPELISGGQPGPAADLWALGCMLYQLLAGRTPFNGDERTELFNTILAYKHPGALEFPSSVPDAAQDLIKQLLHPDPERRLAADGNFAALKEHPFFRGVDWKRLPDMMPPKVGHGVVAASEIESKLRQRKYSMLLTKAIPRKYHYVGFVLPAVPEAEAGEESDASHTN